MPGLALAVFLFGTGYLGSPSADPIVVEKTVNASPPEVWRAWTTAEGVKEWLAADAKVELRPNGPYEVYFDANGIQGQRGSEGCRVLSWLPGRMVSFSWNAPPNFPVARRTKGAFVVVELTAVGKATRVRLTHDGMGEGPEAVEARAYFQRVWPKVLDALENRFVKGRRAVETVTPKPAPKRQTYAILMNPVRKDFLKTMTPEEQRTVGAHFVRLKALTEEGIVILAGPTDEDHPTGLVIFEATDLDAAKAFLAEDPAVKAGIFAGRVVPFSLALLRDR